MIKTHVRHSIAALLVLGFAASGCAVDTDESAPLEEKVAQPSQEVFDYAPEGETIEVPKQAAVLDAKGSQVSKFGHTYTQSVVIDPNQTVSFKTSGGSVGVDPVLVLFNRTDGIAEIGLSTEYTKKIGINTLAFNDDSVGLHSAVTFTNNRGHRLNAHLMVFAYQDRTGTVTLTNNITGGTTTADVSAGGWQLPPGNTGKAWTSNSGGGDPWLFTVSSTAVVGSAGDGFYNDDKAGFGDSEIPGVHAEWRWYVANGWGSGTTTINN